MRQQCTTSSPALPPPLPPLPQEFLLPSIFPPGWDSTKRLTQSTSLRRRRPPPFSPLFAPPPSENLPRGSLRQPRLLFQAPARLCREFPGDTKGALLQPSPPSLPRGLQELGAQKQQQQQPSKAGLPSKPPWASEVGSRQARARRGRPGRPAREGRKGESKVLTWSASVCLACRLVL